MFPLSKYSKLITYCAICTTSKLNKSSASRFMNKVLNETKNKRKWQSNTVNVSENIPLPTNLAKGASEGKRSANAKRVAVLNKVFMRYITDLMATGNNSSVYLGRGIEINRVKVTPDFRGVNVFWVAKGTENDDDIEKLLIQNAGSLRHELSQLRVMGVVPKINFVKDKEYAKLIEVDQRLLKADFGEDYVPVEPTYRFKSNLSLNSPLPKVIKEQIEALEDDTEIEEDIPAMRNDVFGLNQTEIMSKVQKSIKKSQAVHRNQTESSTNLTATINEDPIQFESQRQQKEAFQQFLLKRQIHRAKAKKEKDKYNPEYEYFRSENIKYYEGTPFTEELKDIEDFIEEEDNKRL